MHALPHCAKVLATILLSTRWAVCSCWGLFWSSICLILAPTTTADRSSTDRICPSSSCFENECELYVMYTRWIRGKRPTEPLKSKEFVFINCFLWRSVEIYWRSLPKAHWTRGFITKAWLAFDGSLEKCVLLFVLRPISRHYWWSPTHRYCHWFYKESYIEFESLVRPWEPFLWSLCQWTWKNGDCCLYFVTYRSRSWSAASSLSNPSNCGPSRLAGIKCRGEFAMGTTIRSRAIKFITGRLIMGWFDVIADEKAPLWHFIGTCRGVH